MGIEYYAFALFITGLLCLVAILCKVLFADVRRQRKLLDEKETKLLRLFQTVEDVMEGFNDQVEEAREEIKKHQTALATREAALRAAAFPEKYEPQTARPEPQMRREAPARSVQQPPVRNEMPPVRAEMPARGEAPRYEAQARRETPPPRYNAPPPGYEPGLAYEAPPRYEPQQGYAPAAGYKAQNPPARQEPKITVPETFRPRPVEVTPARAEPVATGGVGIKAYGTGGSGVNTGGVTFQRMIDELVDDVPGGGGVQGFKNGRNASILQLKAEGKSVAQIARELGITQNEVKLVIGLNG